jgi:peptide/nickel transport system ATP-binding protein
MTNQDTVLSVSQLNIGFAGRQGSVQAVHQLDFSVARGETLAIVGESGCGKSLTALSLLGLVPVPGYVRCESILLEGRDISGLDDEALRALRGNRIAMVFQEPMTALNPVLTIGEQIVETIRAHRRMSRGEAKQQAIALLERVRMPEASRRFGEFPHRLSGGMRQRVMIAMALACSPAVLVADEPTTALDVTIQAQILDLIDELKRDTGMAVILITHDLGIVSEHSDRVLVMYAGRKVEERKTDDLFAYPLHPYTRGLIGARPGINESSVRGQPLTEIPGMVPPLHAMPPGCPFAPRCFKASAQCGNEVPPLTRTDANSQVSCFNQEARNVASFVA